MSSSALALPLAIWILYNYRTLGVLFGSVNLFVWFCVCHNYMETQWQADSFHKKRSMRHRFGTVWDRTVLPPLCLPVNQNWFSISGSRSSGQALIIDLCKILPVCCKFSLDSLKEDWEHVLYTLFSNVASYH